MENNNLPAARKLPTLKEIESMELSKDGEMNALNVLLNSTPPSAWLKPHPMASNVTYLPIDKVEFLLTKIFLHWYTEVLNLQVMANSAVVTVRLFYKNPFGDNYFHQDGIGASPIDTKKDCPAMDWNNVNRDSVMKAAPSAESYAIKDAADKIGRLFGKDLNRKNLIDYSPLLDDQRFVNAKLTEK